MVTLLLLLGCTAGLSPESQIPNLRIIGTVVEPPELAPEQTAAVTVVVGSPDAADVDVLVWTCLPELSGRCAEAGEVGPWAVTGRSSGGRLSVSVAPPADATAAVTATGQPLRLPLYTLACEPGRCPLIDTAMTSPERGTPAWDDLVEGLSDPSSAVRELGFDGVALARQTLVVSPDGPVPRNQNPVLTGPGTITGAAGDEAPPAQQFTVSDDGDDILLYGFTTLGGFDAPADAFAGEAELTWYPGPEATPGESGEAWVVAVDGRGGSAVWQGTVEVSP